MRVLLNGREIGGLEPGLERRLSGRPSDRPIAAVAFSARDAVAARARELRLLLGGTAALALGLLAVNVSVVALRAPQAIGWVLLALAIAVVLIGALVFGIYALMLGDHRRRVEARAPSGTLPAGTTVRLDARTVSIGGETWPWTALRIEQVGVRERLANKRRDIFVEQLTLGDGRRSVSLDALFLTNGRAVLEQAWRRIRTPA